MGGEAGEESGGAEPALPVVSSSCCSVLITGGSGSGAGLSSSESGSSFNFLRLLLRSVTSRSSGVVGGSGCERAVALTLRETSSAETDESAVR